MGHETFWTWMKCWQRRSGLDLAQQRSRKTASGRPIRDLDEQIAKINTPISLEDGSDIETGHKP